VIALIVASFLVWLVANGRHEKYLSLATNKSDKPTQEQQDHAGRINDSVDNAYEDYIRKRMKEIMGGWFGLGDRKKEPGK